MSAKEKFIEKIKSLIEKSENFVWDDKEAEAYWNALSSEGDVEKPEFTENGKKILGWLQSQEDGATFKARDIAEGLFISSRSVSGSVRKLCTDGYVLKLGQDPAVYGLTEKGREKKLD